MTDNRNHLPHFAEGTVVAGFGRGGKDLGIPTANYPEDVIRCLPPDFECGVYYGWAKVSDGGVFKMVMCVGWNPYYHNTVKTMETHIIHKFDNDFYGDHLKIIVLGYIRAMCDYSSLEALIEAIHGDIAFAERRLEDPNFLKYKHHPFFSAPPDISMINGSVSHPSESTGNGACLIDSKPVNSCNGVGSRSEIESNSCQQNGHISKMLDSEEKRSEKIPERSVNGFISEDHSHDEKEIQITNLKAKNTCSKKSLKKNINMIHDKTLNTQAGPKNIGSDTKVADGQDNSERVRCENNICRL